VLDYIMYLTLYYKNTTGMPHLKELKAYMRLGGSVMVFMLVCADNETELTF
jgi:hypothetical protein